MLPVRGPRVADRAPGSPRHSATALSKSLAKTLKIVSIRSGSQSCLNFCGFNHVNFRAVVSGFKFSQNFRPQQNFSQSISPFSRMVVGPKFLLPPLGHLYLCSWRPIACGKNFGSKTILLYTYTHVELILVSVGGSDPSCLGGTRLVVLACECYSTINRTKRFAVVHMYLCQRQLAPGSGFPESGGLDYSAK